MVCVSASRMSSARIELKTNDIQHTITAYVFLEWLCAFDVKRRPLEHRIIAKQRHTSRDRALKHEACDSCLHRSSCSNHPPCCPVPALPPDRACTIGTPDPLVQVASAAACVAQDCSYSNPTSYHHHMLMYQDVIHLGQVPPPGRMATVTSASQALLDSAALIRPY